MIDLSNPGTDAASVIRVLDLKPHPEGGYFRETWRDTPPGGGRGAGTAIHFLLAAGDRSHWHKVDAAEMWIWQAGAPLCLSIHPHGDTILGPDLSKGQVFQGPVPKDHWQAASSLGAWTLCTCIVTPAFVFEGFELAPPGWSPG